MAWVWDGSVSFIGEEIQKAVNELNAKRELVPREAQQAIDAAVKQLRDASSQLSAQYCSGRSWFLMQK